MFCGIVLTSSRFFYLSLTTNWSFLKQSAVVDAKCIVVLPLKLVQIQEKYCEWTTLRCAVRLRGGYSVVWEICNRNCHQLALKYIKKTHVVLITVDFGQSFLCELHFPCLFCFGLKCYHGASENRHALFLSSCLLLFFNKEPEFSAFSEWRDNRFLL